MLAAFWPVCKKDILNLQKFVPAACGTMNFVKRLTKKVCVKNVPEKKPMEVLTRASEEWRQIL